MESTKKMILIEPEMLERLKSKETASDDSLSRLDKEMHTILKRKIDDREKWALYTQVLQRYLYVTKENRKPVKMTFQTEEDEYKTDEVSNETTVPAPTNLEEDVLDKKSRLDPYFEKLNLERILPKTYQKKGQVLLEYIYDNKEIIHWKADGTLIIKNNEIPGTNISDLLSDIIRPLKQRPRPIGWQKFAEVIKEIRVPLVTIGNPHSLNYINKLLLTEFQQAPTININTPKSQPSTSKLKLKRKIDWEAWTPY